MRFILGLSHDSKRLPSDFDFRPSFEFHSLKGSGEEVASLYTSIVFDVAEYNEWGPYDLNRIHAGNGKSYGGFNGVNFSQLPPEDRDSLPGSDPGEVGIHGHRTW